MTTNKFEASRVTQTLVTKMQRDRGRKPGFWTSSAYKIDTQEEEPIQLPESQSPPPKTNRLVKPLLLFLAAIFIVISTLLVARPDLFRFINYSQIDKAISKIYSKVSSDNLDEHSSPSSISENTDKNLSVTSRKKTKTVEPDINLSVNTSRLPQISLKGKLFKWTDDNGAQHYSNTEFPWDNPTLQVQAEGQTYSRVTKAAIIGNNVYIPVTLRHKGQALKTIMLIDTRSRLTVLPYATINGLNVEYGETIRMTKEDGKKISGNKTTLDMIEVGPMMYKNVIIGAVSDSGPRNSGFLGRDCLSKHPLKVDYDKQLVVWL